MVLAILTVSCDQTLTGGTATTAASSTAVTSTVNMTLPQGVTVKCGLTLLTDARMVARCRFNNTTGNAQHFLYCMMIDLRQGLKAPVAGTSGDHVRVGQSGNVVSCTKQDATGQFSGSSFHFGCEEISLAPNEAKVITLQSASSYVPPPGVSPAAQDFLVSYADAAVVAPGVTYNPTNCRLGLGEEQAGFVTFNFANNFIGAYWVVSQVPFVDPFIGLARKLGEPAEPKEYSLLDDAPCLPSRFPTEIKELPKCPRREAPPPLTVDLNLFYHESHMAELGTRFPAVMDVDVKGDDDGVRLEIDPAPGEPFVIPGGRETFGTLRACAAEARAECRTPRVKEGSRLDVTVNFRDPATRELLFVQYVTFVGDTAPPILEQIELEDGELRVVATDEVSSPIHAVAWLSHDEGETWRAVEMEADPPLITEDERDDDVRRREFFLRTQTGKDPLRYFVTVQDELYNLVVSLPQD